MTVLEVIRKSADYLAKKGVESPRLQAELLLAHTLKMPRMKLYLDFERVLTEAELAPLRERVRRRGSREPLQHIVGNVSFCGIEIAVNPHVLIPRPETELLAERGWKFLQSLAAAGVAEPAALDFGTGSGCLAVALAVQCPSSRILAADISAETLRTASANAEAHGAASRICFFQSDGLVPLADKGPFHLVISNPPYIPTTEITSLEPEVRDFDPRTALDGGPDGLDFYRQIAAEVPALLAPGGRCMLEFGDGQADALRAIFTGNRWKIESVECDGAGRERYLTARPVADA